MRESRDGVSREATCLGDLQSSGDVYCGLVEPACDTRPPDKEPRLLRENAEHLLGHIAGEFRIAGPPHHASDHKAFILADEFLERTIAPRVAPLLEESGIVANGNGR